MNLQTEFYLPKSVSDEVQAKQDKACNSIQSLIEAERLKVREPSLVSLARSLNQRLGRGESEAIALAIELDADYIILDDFVARREASRLGRTIKGTLAIVRRLTVEGKVSIDNLDEFYKRLVKIGFRVKKSLFDRIFES